MKKILITMSIVFLLGCDKNKEKAIDVRSLSDRFWVFDSIKLDKNGNLTKHEFDDKYKKREIYFKDDGTYWVYFRDSYNMPYMANVGTWELTNSKKTRIRINEYFDTDIDYSAIMLTSRDLLIRTVSESELILVDDSFKDGVSYCYYKSSVVKDAAEISKGDLAVSNLAVRSTPVNKMWRRVCWSPELGLFAVVATGTKAANGGADQVVTSPDGINWTLRKTPDMLCLGICWSKEKNMFVVVGQSTTSSPNQNVMTSSDGVNWTARNGANNNSFAFVCWAKEKGLFVAVSNTGTGNRVMTSPDGINWTERNAPAFDWHSVCWSAKLGLFVACAINYGPIMTSQDGISWTLANSPAGYWMNTCWSDDLEMFVVAGANNTDFLISADGVSWLSCDVGGGNWRQVCWSPEMGMFLAVANVNTDEKLFLTSKDGLSWTRRKTPENQEFWSVCWSKEVGIFVAASRTGTIVTSSIPKN